MSLPVEYNQEFTCRHGVLWYSLSTTSKYPLYQ